MSLPMAMGSRRIYMYYIYITKIYGTMPNLQTVTQKKFNKSHQTRLSTSHKHARSVGSSDTIIHPLYVSRYFAKQKKLSQRSLSHPLHIPTIYTLAEHRTLAEKELLLKKELIRMFSFVFERITLSSLFITLIKLQYLSVCSCTISNAH